MHFSTFTTEKDFFNDRVKIIFSDEQGIEKLAHQATGLRHDTNIGHDPCIRLRVHLEIPDTS